VPIGVLVADDDVHVLRCYQKAFASPPASSGEATLASLSNELFGDGGDRLQQPVFDVVACSQGDEAVEKVTASRCRSAVSHRTLRKSCARPERQEFHEFQGDSPGKPGTIEAP
jgi:hypothetical protein